MAAPIAPPEPVALLADRVPPRTVEEAEAQFATRRAHLLRNWGMRLRLEENGVLPAWDDHSPAALRMIAAGMEVLTDGDEAFAGPDWALFSGLADTKPLDAHRAKFKEIVLGYFDQVHAYTEVGTEGPGKDEDASGGSGDYDFPLRDVVALIYLFLDDEEVLTNDMIWKLISHQVVTAVETPDGWAVTGEVPFSGQDLDEWLAAGPHGRHYFHEQIPIVDEFPLNVIFPTPSIKMSSPETENHLLNIYAWRFLLHDYVTFVARLTPDHRLSHRADPRVRALFESDPARYENGPGIIDFVLQLLGRVPHSGMYENNGKPYAAYAIAPMLAFYQASDQLFPDDPDRQRIRVAAHNALDYLAAEFTFQSLEGKRIAPFRRNYKHEDETSFYASDYAPHIFGVLTGAYVFPDDERGPYHHTRIGQEGGFALWAVLSGYRVPRAIHDLALNKHGGYFARVQTRYSTTSYPLEYTVNTGGFDPILNADPPKTRPRYFEDPSDVPGPGDFTPATQLYFATPDYLNSAGGHHLPYYFEIDVPLVVVDLLIAGTVGLPPIPGLRNLVRDFLNDAINGLEIADKLRGSDIKSRPSTLIPRGDLQVGGGTVGELEGVLPAMRGQDDFWASKNVNTYKSFSLGYTFRPGGNRHQAWPQRYPEAWNAFVAERFGIGRAAFQIFDFVDQPDHPLAGHYWVIARFSKSVNLGQFRRYGRGFWEVVPGHQFPDAAALRAHIEDTNPGKHFDDDEDNHYAYRMATTGETIVIDKLFGSTATDQGILELRSAAGEKIPLHTYLADMRDREALRQIPLMDVWQVDRDHGFTGLRYAHADGHGRVVVHNPFVGQTVRLDSSDYRAPARSVDESAVTSTSLPPIPGTDGQVPSVSALARGPERLYATQYYWKKPDITPSPQPGELLALDPVTLAVLNRVPVGRSPHAIGLHEATGTLYVANYTDVSLSVIDAASFTALGTIQFLGFGIIDLAVSQKFHRVFVPQHGQKRVLVVDGATRTPLADMADLPVLGTLALHEPTDRLYVSVKNPANPALQDLVEFEITADGQRELGRVTIDNQVSRAPAMAVDAANCYVLGFGDRPGMARGQKLFIIDRRTRQVAGVVPLETGGGLAVAASASQRVVCISTLNGVQLIDTRTLEVLRTIDLGGQMKGAVAMDEATGTAYFGASHSSAVHTWTRVPMGQ